VTKVVLRLLDSDGALVGWAVHHARLRGDGCLRASSDVEIRMPVVVGGMPSFVAFRFDDPLIRIGEMPGPLPAITVGSVAVGIPVGAMGARG
jgi:hypothetical protein